MLENGRITYEFEYEPGKVLVHPVLDRLAFVLRLEIPLADGWRLRTDRLDPRQLASQAIKRARSRNASLEAPEVESPGAPLDRRPPHARAQRPGDLQAHSRADQSTHVRPLPLSTYDAGVRPECHVSGRYATALAAGKPADAQLRRMSLLQLKREAVPPTSLTQRQDRFQTVAHESYPFGQSGLGECGHPTPGSHVTPVPRENRHGWGSLSKGLEAACSNGRIRGGRRRMHVVSPPACPFPDANCRGRSITRPRRRAP